MIIAFNRSNSALVGRLAPFILGLAFGALPAAAQQSMPATVANTSATTPAEGEIIVTGSRISRPDLEATSPVAVLSAEALKQNNIVTVEQLLTANPQFVASGTSASNNPGNGSATVNLRGLGSNRTLVLIDGKRAPVYDTTGSVDVNTIPTALIKRIDILTGGASAVYGSDAISGVVNFILDDRFMGMKADASSQISGRGDGAQYDISLTGGLKLGERGNLIVSGGYSKREGVKYAERPRNAFAVDSSDLVTPAGSSNTVPTAFDLPGQGRVQVTDSGGLTSDVVKYNFTPVNFAQLPFERYNAVALGRYELTDGIEAYARANYEHVKVVTTLAPTATAGFFFNIDPRNPFLTPAERIAFFNPATAVINDGSEVGADPTARAGTSAIGIRRRIIETGGRIEEHTTKSYQVVGGLRGSIGDSLRWDIFGQYGEVKRHEILRNDLSYTALQQALDVVPGPNGPVCFNPANGCVPLNLFTTATIPQSQLTFVLRDALQDTKTTQLVAGGNVSGDLGFLKSPFAAKPAAFSAGVEYRRETGRTSVDDNFASGDLIYYGQGQNIAGNYDTKEAYIELKMPIVQDRPFFNSLDVEGGFRYSNYSTVGSVYTYKGGGNWSPVEGIRFRGVYQRAVRAPNIFELFSPIVASTGSLNRDPCAGAGISAQIAAICVAQGAPANSIGRIPVPISGQINVFTGGNPDLKAEKTNTFTVGMVLNPPRFRNFTFSVDYYNIVIANAIDVVPPFITADQCYNVLKDANSAACRGIKRNTLDGSLSGNTQFGLPQTLGNIAALKTDGIDVSASYRGGDPEGFNYAFSVAGTYTLSFAKQADPTAVPVECAGRFGSACNPIEPIAKWKHVVDINLGFDQVRLLTRWRYFGAVRQDIGTDILKKRISGFTYIDETVSFDVSDKYSFRIGVQNLFDKKSPIVGDTVGTDVNAGSTFPNTYDVIGRTLFAGVSAKF